MTTTTTTRTIAPAAVGLRVRCPDGHVLDPAGETVTWETFWERRMRDGDIVEARSEKREVRSEK